VDPRRVHGVRGPDVQQRGELLVLDLEGVHPLERAALGDRGDRGDHLAGEPDHVAGEDRTVPDVVAPEVAALGQVPGSDDGHHAGHGQCTVDVDGHQPGVRDVAAEQLQVQRALGGQVGGEQRRPVEFRPLVAARDRRAHHATRPGRGHLPGVEEGHRSPACPGAASMPAISHTASMIAR
jgi:hypothetical protein